MNNQTCLQDCYKLPMSLVEDDLRILNSKGNDFKGLEANIRTGLAHELSKRDQSWDLVVTTIRDLA